MKKFLIITAAVIAVLGIALTVLIKIYVTPERVKEFVIPTAEESLNRKVSIGDISISLFKGIGISDFAIMEADQKSDFIKCKEFVLKFQLLPLLAKKVIVDELRLVSPAVHIDRGADGAFNFEDIGQKKKAEKAENGKPEGEVRGLPISLLVNQIAVQDAQFSLADSLKKLPDVRSSADINISIESVDGSNLFTKGSIDLKLDEIVMKKPAAKRIKDLAAALDYAVTVNLQSKDIRVDKADMKVKDIFASIKGDVKNIKTAPEVDISVTVPKIKTSAIQNLAALFADVKGLSLSGDLEADVQLKGVLEKLDTLKAKGTISMDSVGITYNEINASLDGDITFDEKLMNIDLKSTIDKNTAAFKGSVSNYFKNQNITLNIYSEKLYLDRLIPAGKAETKPSAQDSKPVAEKKVSKKISKEAEPLDLKMTAAGEIKVDTAVYQNMVMSDFSLQYTLKDNKLEIPRMSAKAGKGTFNVNGFVDLSKPGYTYKLSGTIDSLHSNEIVNAFFPKAKDTVFGIISLNLKMNGAGTLPQNIKKNLVGNGDFNIQDGKITGAEITKGLSQFLSVNELKTINLKEAKGTIDINNGIARLNSIFSSDNLAMDPSGNIGLDETLDLAFDLKLSPRLTDKAMSSKIAKYIKSEEGWGTIPLIVSGTFSDPKYTVDVAKAGKQVIKKKVDKYIDKLLEKEDAEKKKELEPVKDLLKGIFQ